MVSKDGEYGATTSVPRILELLDRHQVPATFFIPAMGVMLHPEMVPAIVARHRHEIGVHGWVHPLIREHGFHLLYGLSDNRSAFRDAERAQVELVPGRTGPTCFPLASVLLFIPLARRLKIDAKQCRT